MDYLKVFLSANVTIEISGTGNSMEPIIHQGDKLIIGKVSTVEIGDIVIYRMKDKYVVHRIISVIGRAIKIKGDNALSAEVIPERMICGKVEEICSQKRRFMYRRNIIGRRMVATMSSAINQIYVKTGDSVKTKRHIVYFLFKAISNCEVYLLAVMQKLRKMS